MKYDSLDVLDAELLMVLANIHSTSMFNCAHLHALYGRWRGKTNGEINRIVRRAEKLGLVDTTDDDYTRSFRRGKAWVQETIPSKLIRLSMDSIETIKLLYLIQAEDPQADALLELAAEEAAAEQLRRFDVAAAASLAEMQS